MDYLYKGIENWDLRMVMLLHGTGQLGWHTISDQGCWLDILHVSDTLEPSVHSAGNDPHMSTTAPVPKGSSSMFECCLQVEITHLSSNPRLALDWFTGACKGRYAQGL